MEPVHVGGSQASSLVDIPHDGVRILETSGVANLDKFQHVLVRADRLVQGLVLEGVPLRCDRSTLFKQLGIDSSRNHKRYT